jgi:hypothetical protein
MPRSNDPALTRHQECLINRLALHYYLFGYVPVDIMIAVESEGINAEALLDEIIEQVPHNHTTQ